MQASSHPCEARQGRSVCRPAAIAILPSTYTWPQTTHSNENAKLLLKTPLFAIRLNPEISRSSSPEAASSPGVRRFSSLASAEHGYLLFATGVHLVSLRPRLVCVQVEIRHSVCRTMLLLWWVLGFVLSCLPNNSRTSSEVMLGHATKHERITFAALRLEYGLPFQVVIAFGAPPQALDALQSLGPGIGSWVLCRTDEVASATRARGSLKVRQSGLLQVSHRRCS